MAGDFPCGVTDFFLCGGADFPYGGADCRAANRELSEAIRHSGPKNTKRTTRPRPAKTAKMAAVHYVSPAARGGHAASYYRRVELAVQAAPVAVVVFNSPANTQPRAATQSKRARANPDEASQFTWELFTSEGPHHRATAAPRRSNPHQKSSLALLHDVARDFADRARARRRGGVARRALAQAERLRARGVVVPPSDPAWRPGGGGAASSDEARDDGCSREDDAGGLRRSAVPSFAASRVSSLAHTHTRSQQQPRLRRIASVRATRGGGGARTASSTPSAESAGEGPPASSASLTRRLHSLADADAPPCERFGPVPWPTARVSSSEIAVCHAGSPERRGRARGRSSFVSVRSDRARGFSIHARRKGNARAKRSGRCAD